MKKLKHILVPSLTLLLGAMLLTGCNNPSPEKYFDMTVLNTNVFVGFADNGMLRELETPSVKQVAGSDAVVAMKRTEIIDDKINFAEENLGKIRKLKATEDTKDIVNSSLELYEFMIPVYKKEYTQLAKLYDADVNAEDKHLLAMAIHDQYFSRYDLLSKKLIENGKLFATRHQITVNWGN